MSRLDEIRERLAKATPRPWQRYNDKKWTIFAPYGFGEVIAITGREGDAEFITHAPQDIAYLLAEIDDLVAAVSEELASKDGASLGVIRQHVLDFQERTDGT